MASTLLVLADLWSPPADLRVRSLGRRSDCAFSTACSCSSTASGETRIQTEEDPFDTFHGFCKEPFNRCGQHGLSIAFNTKLSLASSFQKAEVLVTAKTWDLSSFESLNNFQLRGFHFCSCKPKWVKEEPPSSGNFLCETPQTTSGVKLGVSWALRPGKMPFGPRRPGCVSAPARPAPGRVKTSVFNALQHPERVETTAKHLFRSKTFQTPLV